MVKQTTSSKNSGAKRSTVKNRARKITEESTEIRRKVKELALEAINAGNLTLDQLSELSSEILSGATSALNDLIPSSQKSALRQVVDGISDAWAVTAEAGAASILNARKYGVKFAERDLTKLGQRLQSVEKDFVSALEEFASSMQGDLSEELSGMASRFKKAGTAIGPAVKTARKALTEHGLEVVGEVVSVSMKASQKALNGALLTVSGIFKGVNRTTKTPSEKN